MNPIAKFLVVSGVLLIIAGIAWQFGGKHLSFLGRLPGDVSIQRENFRFYFPIATSLLVSIVLSLLVWLFRRL